MVTEKKEKFLPGDYIITRTDNKKGYVIDVIEDTGYYEVRVREGYVVLTGEELERSHSKDI
jgi:hypothetical protein